MAQFIGQPERRTSLAEMFGAGVGRGIERGQDFASQMAVQQQRLQNQKAQEIEALKSMGFSSIQNMRDIISRGQTGWNPLGFITPQGRADRAALDTAALNLERLAADMVGKGTLSRQRFEFLKERLPSSGKTDAENEAILNEWENILGMSEETSEKPRSKTRAVKPKFNIQDPEHKAKRDQLMKSFGGNQKKVREALLREFEE